MPRVDRVQKCLVRCVEFLIAAPAESRIVDLVFRPPVEVRITRIDPAKVRQQRDESSVPMIDAVANPMNFRDLGPSKNITKSCGIGNSYNIHYFLDSGIADH